jgi:hypothetical protein
VNDADFLRSAIYMAQQLLPNRVRYHGNDSSPPNWQSVPAQSENSSLQPAQSFKRDAIVNCEQGFASFQTEREIMHVASDVIYISMALSRGTDIGQTWKNALAILGAGVHLAFNSGGQGEANRIENALDAKLATKWAPLKM